MIASTALSYNHFKEAFMYATEILRRYRRSINPPYKPRDLLPIGATFLLVLFIPAIIVLLFNHSTLDSQAQTPPSFTFTAAGDYSGHATRTTAVLTGMNPENSGADFNLALGDLSYGNKTPETAWCDYVKSNVGETFPFELIPGNHEDDGPAGNNIDNFELCLPHRLGPITGRYSREYYFDYPSTSPLARFIAISPQMIFTDEGQYTYTTGNAHYNWVASSIDSARAAGIRWVVVGMHINCITMGRKSCGMGTSLFNLLVEKKVDLILQGHDHNYQRSKQLALSPTCIGIVPGSYNPNCVSDDGSDDIYTKGAGTIVNIVGTGGIGNYDINASDSEAPYFVKWVGLNSNPTVGFLKATVTNTHMSLSFHSMYGPAFSDSFIIEDTSVPTSAPVPPTTTPIPTPTPTIDPFAPTPTPIESGPIPTPTQSGPTETPIPSPTPLASPTPLVLTLNPIADTTVKSNKPTTNYGSATKLSIDGSPIEISYLRFDLAPLAGRTIRFATLRLRITDSSTSTQNVKSVADSSWQETTMTYNTRPPLGSTITSLPGGTSGTWREVTVTSGVSGSAGGFLSLGIDSTGTNGLDAYSRENPTDKPALVITYE